MKYASDFRRIARDALRGKWLVAVLTAFVASLIGATLAPGGSSGSIGGSSSSSSDSSSEFFSSELFETLLPIIIVILIAIVIWVIVLFVISGAGKLGYAKFNLNLVDNRPAAFSDLFSQFNRIGDGWIMDILVSLFTTLWTLLFIIPGIIKAYSYSMTPYILSEHPELSANDAITESRRIMDGNKWRLFCLEFSFIGWSLLAIVPAFILLPIMFLGETGIFIWLIITIPVLIITNSFVLAYQETARAAFYRDISNAKIPDAANNAEQFVEYFVEQ